MPRAAIGRSRLPLSACARSRGCSPPGELVATRRLIGNQGFAPTRLRNPLRRGPGRQDCNRPWTGTGHLRLASAPV